MTNLLKKILGKQEKAEISTRMNADEIKPFFERLGIDIETIGFPGINTRHLIPTERYWITFKNVRVFPIIRNPDGERTPEIVINGDYEIQPMASYQDSSLGWHPGLPTLYSFRIEKGELNLTDLTEN